MQEGTAEGIEPGYKSREEESITYTVAGLNTFFGNNFDSRCELLDHSDLSSLLHLHVFSSLRYPRMRFRI